MRAILRERGNEGIGGEGGSGRIAPESFEQLIEAHDGEGFAEEQTLPMRKQFVATVRHELKP